MTSLPVYREPFPNTVSGIVPTTARRNREIVTVDGWSKRIVSNRSNVDYQLINSILEGKVFNRYKTMLTAVPLTNNETPRIRANTKEAINSS